MVLSMPDKLDIFDMLDKSVSYGVICEKYGIGRSTVGDIRKNRDKLTKPISGPLLCEKALELSKCLNKEKISVQVKDGSGDSVKGMDSKPVC